MRIALTQKKTTWSGQSLQVWELAVALRERGHEVFLIAPPRTGFSERAQAAGFPLLKMYMNGLGGLGGVFRMARFLREHRVEILHCHDPWEHQMGCLGARLAGVRALVRTKCNTLPLRNAFSRLIHGPLTSRMMSVSDAVKDVLVDCGIAPDHITTVYNYVDCEKFRPRPPSPELKRSLSLSDDSPIVGTVGRLHKSKGIADLIRAVPTVAAAVPRVRFLFVGGRHEQWLPLVEELSVEQQCVFTGRVPNETVPDYLNLMDVVVFPTHREALGLVILEAMAVRRPVVATRVGGVPEVVQDGVNGLLVEPHSPDQMAGAVLRLLSDDALRERLAAAAYRTATETFTRDRYLEKVERVYAMVLR